MRILGKGLTAQAIADRFEQSIMYDDSDLPIFDKTSDELTVVSPGIPPHNMLVRNTKNLISEYDLFAEIMPFSIWISGTNGKTTTTQMIDFLLESHGATTGGNIGTPLAKLDKDASIWVLETSSFTLHYTNRAKPNIYILLPISEDHIYWHGSFEAYVEAKLKPLTMMQEGDIAIIPAKYQTIPNNAFIIPYENSFDLASAFGIDYDNVRFLEPFKMDALMALGVYKILFDRLPIEKLNSFKIDAHKLEFFNDSYGRVWVDDSKATNVDATIWALKNFAGKDIYIILGGDDKGADLNPLFGELLKYRCTVFSIGKNEAKLVSLSAEYGIELIECKTLDVAVSQIHKRHEINSIALLSPAAASLDQFSGYKQRGEMFKKYVFEL